MNKKAVLQESVRHHARSAKRLPYINAKQRPSYKKVAPTGFQGGGCASDRA